MSNPVTPNPPPRAVLTDPRSTGQRNRPPVVDILGLRGTKKP